MGRIVVLSLVAFALTQAVSGAFGAEGKHRILAVFAHPDDEITVAPMLAKYAAEGHEVYLVTATSGQAGGANTDIPEGPELGAAREKEVRCSARELGIHEPFLFQLQDGRMAEPQSMAAMASRLREVIDRVKPEVMITFGPDGVTGHPDHRIVGAVASEVFQWRERLEWRPKKLYYVVLPASRMQIDPATAGLSRQTAAVSDEFITAVVDADEGMDATWRAMQCHVTQWAPVERMRRMFEMRRKIIGGKVHLRLALTAGASGGPAEDDVFDGLD